MYLNRQQLQKELNMFAISTSWKSNLHYNVKGILGAIKATGINAIEVGYNFKVERFEELVLLINELGIKVVSVHNFCPMPAGSIPGRLAPCDYYRLSSQDDTERCKAVDYTKRSIDSAVKLSAKALVIHSGTIDIDRAYVKNLLGLYNSGASGTREYNILKEELLRIREARKKPYLDATVKSLEEITAFAFGSGMKVGIENRYYPNEIPNIGEIDHLLKLFSTKGAVYWHDTGHAEVSEKLGIALHAEYLNRFKDHLFGIHIHDLKGIKDHLAPFSGELDFSKIIPYIKDNLLNVIEAHPPATAEQLQESIKRFNINRVNLPV